MNDTIEERLAAIIVERLDERLAKIEGAMATADARRPETLLDRKALAAWARCSVRTVDLWIKEGVPCVRLNPHGGSPRFLASEVRDWLRRREERADGAA